jgi:hypothetical protein
VKAIVVIEVRHAAPLVSRLVSPAYEDGTTTEAGMIQAHSARFARLREHRANGWRPFLRQPPIRRSNLARGTL